MKSGAKVYGRLYSQSSWSNFRSTSNIYTSIANRIRNLQRTAETIPLQLTNMHSTTHRGWRQSKGVHFSSKPTTTSPPTQTAASISSPSRHHLHPAKFKHEQEKKNLQQNPPSVIRTQSYPKIQPSVSTGCNGGRHNYSPSREHPQMQRDERHLSFSTDVICDPSHAANSLEAPRPKRRCRRQGYGWLRWCQPWRIAHACIGRQGRRYKLDDRGVGRIWRCWQSWVWHLLVGMCG